MINWNLSCLPFSACPKTSPQFCPTTCLVWPKRLKQALLPWVSPEHFMLSKMHGLPCFGHERGERTESAFDINKTHPVNNQRKMLATCN